MPHSGFDLDSRLVITSVVARTVSPMNTGLGKRVSSIPRLPTVVPNVVSLTETPNDEAESEDAVDQNLAELLLLGELGVQVEWLQVQSKCRKEQVVGFGQCSGGLMLEGHADLKLFKVFSRHLGLRGLERDDTTRTSGVC